MYQSDALDRYATKNLESRGGTVVSGMGSPRPDMLSRKVPIGGSLYTVEGGEEVNTRTAFPPDVYAPDDWGGYEDVEIPTLDVPDTKWPTIYNLFQAPPSLGGGMFPPAGFFPPQFNWPKNVQNVGGGGFIPHGLDMHMDVNGQPFGYGSTTVLAGEANGLNRYQEATIQAVLGRFFTGEADSMQPVGPEVLGGPQAVTRLEKGVAHAIMSMNAGATAKQWETLANLLDQLAGAADGKFLGHAAGAATWLNVAAGGEVDSYSVRYEVDVTATTGTWYDMNMGFIGDGGTSAEGVAAVAAGTGKKLSVIFRELSGHAASDVSFRLVSSAITAGAPVVGDIGQLNPTQQDANGSLAVAAGGALRVQVMQDDGMDKQISIVAYTTFSVDRT